MEFEVIQISSFSVKHSIGEELELNNYLFDEMTLRTETVLTNSAAQNKRKSMSEHDNLETNKNSKVFKDASEFFDQVSNPATEPAAEDVLVEKEVIKGPKVSHKVKKEVEDDEIVVTHDSNEPVQDSNERLIMNNLLVDITIVCF